MSKLIDIIMPDANEGTESVIERWFKQAGDVLKQHEPIIEINTDKVTMEVAAPASGVLHEIIKTDGESVQAGDLLGRIKAGADKVIPAASSESPAPAVSRLAEPPKKVETIDQKRAEKLSPLVKKMLKVNDLDPSQISGSGRYGRITAADIETFLREDGGSKITASPQDPAIPPADGGELPSRMVPHSGTRKRIAAHMVESMLKTAPHVTAVFDADLSAIVAHRSANKAAFAKQGTHLTYTAYFVDAAVKALLSVPEVNSRWHDNALEIYEACNIGIAAATDAGLIVPVIHRAEQLNLLGIAAKLQEITHRARSGQLEQKDIRNGTFTITNHGMTGSLIATPIINQPQSAILGIGKLEKRVVVVESNGQDATVIQPRAYITLTIDHRALDGFQANQFLSKFVETLQQWK